ncbi:Uncharacterized protein HZ326_7431 [Fusarium oxysporum f. sp. albedinis]|nr:Uncharacterized protein HZ326_7431 [Fusarium oxysporum f. sp. albedinis]
MENFQPVPLPIQCHEPLFTTLNDLISTEILHKLPGRPVRRQNKTVINANLLTRRDAENGGVSYSTNAPNSPLSAPELSLAHKVTRSIASSMIQCH